MTTTTTNVGTTSFLNLFGILISIMLCVLFIILGGHTLKYIKAFAVKIKIIVNRARDKNVQVKDFNYQGHPQVKTSEAFNKIESVFKNEIKKSRSLQFCNIFRDYIAKYDHVVFYPFRDKILEQYDLLKPKTTFYTLLIICTACIAWMTTIFLSAILQAAYSDVTMIPLGVFVALTLLIALISSFLNIIATNRLHRIYLINIKSAFKVNYGNEYVDVHSNLKEYEPADEKEQQELFKHQAYLTKGEDFSSLDNPAQQPNHLSNGPDQNLQEPITQRTMREETQLNSTRKLLGEDFERSDRMKLIGNQLEQTVIEERKEEDLEDQDAQQQIVSKLPQKKGKAIKDIFDLQVGIEGVDEADENEKYIFIEDKHAIGDTELLDNEANKGENKSNVTTFIVLFMIIAVASAVCCYLNYTFSKTLAEAVFYMFIGSFLGDLLAFRPLILLIMTAIKMCKGKAQGYTKIEYKSSREIKDLMGKAIKDMFDSRRKMRESFKKGISSDMQALIPEHGKRGSQLSGFGNLSQEDMINNQDYMTQNAYEVGENKQFHGFEDHKEDDFAQVMNDKKDDDLDGNRNPILNLRKGFHPTDYARPQIEDKSKQQFEETQTLNQVQTVVPFFAQLQKAVKDKEDEKYHNIMERKQLVNELVDYNLLLLRKIYDAYEEKADKVLKNFRSDRHGVLRKRYMVPIINPNYDYEKLLKDIKLPEKDDVSEQAEDEGHQDGITVCEDFEQQLMEAIQQEASDDLVQENVPRIRIDKFGNPIDENKELGKADLLPAFGRIEFTVELNIEEDDEDARKLKLLHQYWNREDSGVQFNSAELTELVDLENWRINILESLISEACKNGYENLQDEDKLKVTLNKKERVQILLRQLRRKNPLSEEDRLRMLELERELLELEYEELQIKQRLGILTDDELKRLLELERMFEMEEIEKLRKKMLEGKITDEELKRLRFLESKYRLEHMKNPFEKNMNEESIFNEEEANFMEESDSHHSRITDQDNFAELPPVHVMNNLSKPQSPDIEKRESPEDEEQRRLQEELEKQRLLEEEQEKQRQIEEEEQRRLSEINDQNLKQRMKLQAAFDQIQMDREEDQIKSARRLQELADEEALLLKEQERLQNRINELLEKQARGELTEEELEELQRLQDLLEQNKIKLEELQQERDEELLRQQEEELRRQEAETELYRQQEELERQKREAEEEVARQKREAEEELARQQREAELELERQKNLQNASFNNLENSALAADAIDRDHRSSSSQEGMSRIGSRQQDRFNQKLDENQLEDDVMRATGKNFMDPEFAFGHDDLENAPGGANGEESIYSHKTTTILDEEKVSFMHIEQLPNQDNASDDSFSEQDMVYYNKDDLTNYSKGLGLNKIKIKKQPGQQYFSENDLYEVQEGEISDNESGRSGRSYDHAGKRGKHGRGKIKHNDLDLQEYDDYVEGRVKVDAWNLNYRGKKKKLKKKKVTDQQKRKMNDLQNIYGIDAKTLAGLSKGRLPRQLIASGKFKGEGPDFSRHSDMSFRSTQNTFMKPMGSTATKSRMKASVNDAQSNMFSFNGYGTSKGWNGVGSAFKGGPRDSRFDMGSSQFDQKSTNKANGKKLPNSGMKKMTSTQENFAKLYGQNTRGNFNNEFLEEESKSGHSGSRGGSQARRFGSDSSKKNNQVNGLGKGKNGTYKADRNSSIKKNQRRGSSDGIDSHSESDEAVDDKGAMFQKRNGPWNMNGRSNAGFGGMNDNINDHSESDEGNNQENPDFGGNQFTLKKRNFGGQASNKKGGRNMNNELNLEDLEAQSMQGKRGGKVQRDSSSKKNQNLKGSNGIKQNVSGAKKAFGSDDFGRSGFNNFGDSNGFNQSSKKQNNRRSGLGSAERDEREDSEEENLGSEVLFQKRNPRGDYMFQNDNEAKQMQSKGQHGRNLSKSNSKPPLANSKQNSNRKGRNQGDTDDNEFNNIYGDPYNINGVIHPGVSENMRNSNAGQSDMSDNERRMRRTFNESDGGSNKKGAKKGSQDRISGMRAKGNNSNSNPNLLDPSALGKGTKKRIMRNRSDGDSDFEDDYIVGPESNHSKIKKRPLGQNRSQDEDDEERYLLLQRERQIVQDIESDRNIDGNSSRLAKKRKIRKAAHSQNPKDQQRLKYQEMQNERLKKKQREAEAALFAQGDDLERGQAKLKKKKIKKEWVKKEVNYWLDYDSPYAEYLVARFREWSPNPNQQRVSYLNSNICQGSSANSSKIKGVSSRYKEVQNVYNRGGDSKQNSRSRERKLVNEAGPSINVTQQKKNLLTAQNFSSQQVQKNQFKGPNVNTLFVDDYEEP